MALSSLAAADKLTDSLSCFASLLSSTLTAKGEQNPSNALVTLQGLLAPSSDANPSVCSVPSLSLRNKRPMSVIPASIEKQTAQKLGVPVSCGRAGVVECPNLMARNLSLSLMMLIDSRLRASVMALARQMSATGRDQLQHSKILIKLLSSEDCILWSAAVTSFQIVSPPLNDHGFVLPLVFDAVIDLMALGTTIPTTLQAPGMITGVLSETGVGLRNVELTIDTTALLKEMMKQARYIIRKTVALATEVSSILVKQAASTSMMHSLSSSQLGPQRPTLSSQLNGRFSSTGNLGFVNSADSQRQTTTAPLSQGEQMLRRLAGASSIGDLPSITNNNATTAQRLKGIQSTNALSRSGSRLNSMMPPPPRQRPGLLSLLRRPPMTNGHNNNESASPKKASFATERMKELVTQACKNQGSVPQLLPQPKVVIRPDDTPSDSSMQMPTGSNTSENGIELRSRPEPTSASSPIDLADQSLPHKKRRILSCPDLNCPA